MKENEVYKYLMLAYETEVANRHYKLKKTPELEYQISQIAKWLTNEDSSFGLLLCGGLGNGKSTMMRAIQRLIRNFRIVDEFNEIYYLQIIHSTSIFDMIKDDKKIIELCRTPMLGIDDLGTEPKEYLVYGNIHTPIVKLLSSRYDSRFFTMITTNLTPTQICNYYGARIGDRLNEMMKIIVFPNNSYRANEK